MPTYERCDKSVDALVRDLINKYETNQPLGTIGVKIDLVFAYADVDDDGNKLNDALTKNGIKCLGITRKIPLKDRALGRGDAEIALDGDWWKEATEEQQAALLDHEINHLAIKTDKAGNVQYDDLQRPQLKLRKHDYEFGFFKCIAERHGAASQEQIYAKAMMDHAGQLFWPGIAPTIEISSGGKSVLLSAGALGAFAKATAKKI